MLKWTGALAAAVAIGVGAGYETNQLLRPITTVTQTATQTVPLIEEQVFITTVKNAGSLFLAEVCRVHVRGGRVAWVEPLQLTDDEAKATWTITAGGKTFGAGIKSRNSAIAMAMKSALYSPDRVAYPLKRVGFVPGGGGDISNRGKGEFVRITWSEAFDTVAKEIKRIQQKYGPSALLPYHSPHLSGTALNGCPAVWRRFRLFLGGFTERICEGHTWVCWPYGGSPVWGYSWARGQGDIDDLLQDTLQNSKLVVFWGTDPNNTDIFSAGHEFSASRFWMKELGIRMISINPRLTDTAALHCDQWIPINSGTDTAMALAIAYVWITEGTYDKKYVETHTVGFDKWSDYILGKEAGGDRQPKTPDWASKITGVPANVITSLAREWASKPTSEICEDSGLCRTNYGHEWCRSMILLQAMQGLGKPGVNIWNGRASQPNTSSQKGCRGPAPAIDAVAKTPPANPVTQVIHQLNFHDACYTDFTKNPPMKWRCYVGYPSTMGTTPAMFNTEFTYPMPGFSEVHSVWRFSGGGGYGLMGPDSSSNARNYKNSKIEFVVVQAPSLESEVKYADIVLPASVVGERVDLADTAQYGRLVVYAAKCVEPLGETKPDYDILTGVAERLGFKEAFTEGNSGDDWLRKMYEKSDIPLSWESFKAKGYYAFPFPKNYNYAPAFKWYYDKPGEQITGPTSGLDTPSGKIEFYSKHIANFYGEDSKWCVPRYYVNPNGRWSPLAKKYPLEINAGHSKYRIHSKWRNTPFLQDLYTYQGEMIKGYNVASMNAVDAQPRGIKEGDIVRLFNDTGQVLAYAHITETLMPGVVWLPWGSWYDPMEPGNPDSVDKGGCYNTLVSRWTEGGPYGGYTNSPFAFANHEHSVLAEMEKWKG